MRVFHEKQLEKHGKLIQQLSFEKIAKKYLHKCGASGIISSEKKM